MLEDISDHRKDKTTYSKDDGYVVSHGGNKTLRQTTQVMAAVAAVRVSQTLQSSFTDSANVISKTVSLVFPDTQGKFKKRHAASVKKDG